MLADAADKIVVVRSMVSTEGSHERARHLAHCGHSPNPTVDHRLVGASLLAITDLPAAMQTVTAGRNDMPPFRTALTPDQIRDVSAYVIDALASRPR